jgi:hypothetical protein
MGIQLIASESRDTEEVLKELRLFFALPTESVPELERHIKSLSGSPLAREIEKREREAVFIACRDMFFDVLPGMKSHNQGAEADFARGDCRIYSEWEFLLTTVDGVRVFAHLGTLPSYVVEAYLVLKRRMEDAA